MQDEVIRFLANPATYVPRPDRVETIETHGALVFLAGSEAVKIKRAVKLSYLDFSTLCRRAAACRREIEINRPNAPEIYRDAVPITRAADGSLTFDGGAAPIEWAVRMARFGQEALLSSIAEREGISDPLADALADMVLRAHQSAVPHPDAPSVEAMRGLIDSIGLNLARASASHPGAGDLCRRFGDLAASRLSQTSLLLARRSAAGLVRRCHGDMHLGNVVLWQGRPCLFDAIEFDEALATVDLLYDLAFLLMDLDRRGQRPAARIVLDRYLRGTGRDLDIEGLAALPLFLGLRAAVRALVAFDRARLLDTAERRQTEAHALSTVARAVDYLAPPPARLLAVGGLSGTGKTTLAAALAPRLLPVPGALHLRSDVLRKSLAGVGELDRLPATAYTPEARARVYAHLCQCAAKALSAGHSVVVDAVFAGAAERDQIEAVARACGARFDGLWLEAPTNLLQARVAARTNDASDATPDVVVRQLDYDLGEIAWSRISAGGDPATVFMAACAAIGDGKA